MLGVVTEEARLPMFSLVLGRFCHVEDLSGSSMSVLHMGADNRQQ